MSDYSFLASVYDDFTENVEYAKRADFLCTLFKTYSVKDNASILDLACGTGSLTTILSRRGYEMIGVDSSTEMLCEAQNKKYDEGLDILYLCQDMTELNLFGTVDAVICTLDSLNHLKNTEDVKRVFSLVALFSNPGAVFIFDVNTIYKHRKILGDNAFVYENDDVFCVWQNSLNADDSVDIHLDIFCRENNNYSRFREDFSEIAFEINDCIEWLENADFKILDIFDDYSENRINKNTQRALIAARYIGKDYE